MYVFIYKYIYFREDQPCISKLEQVQLKLSENNELEGEKVELEVYEDPTAKLHLNLRKINKAMVKLIK